MLSDCTGLAIRYINRTLDVCFSDNTIVAVTCDKDAGSPPPIGARQSGQTQAQATFSAQSARVRNATMIPTPSHTHRSPSPALASENRATGRFATELGVQKVLLPTLRPHDIIVIDNLGSHRGKAIRRLIRSVGAKLFFPI